MRTIHIPTSYGNITVDVASAPNEKGGAIALPTCFENPAYDETLNAITSLILAHACAGVDVGSDTYVKGVNAALESIA